MALFFIILLQISENLNQKSNFFYDFLCRHQHILESFAAKKPAIATNVGNCQGLVYGEDDDYGAGGMVVPVLNIKEIADGILKLARDEDLRREMGEIGYRRVIEKYRIESFIESYRQVYDELLGGGIKWQE